MQAAMEARALPARAREPLRPRARARAYPSVRRCTPYYDRTRMADGDYLYINRGSLHGFEIGSEVEVYVPGEIRNERVSGKQMMTPDRIIGRMVLVDVNVESSVAYVVRAERELELGDRVRASTREIVRR